MIFFPASVLEWCFGRQLCIRCICSVLVLASSMYLTIINFMHDDSLMSNRLIMRSKQQTNFFVPQKVVRAGEWLFIILLVGLRLLNGHIF